jgi:5'-AMP-activated protein kinase catalytic alpha subunit
MDFCAKGELFNYIVVKQRLSEKKSAFFYYQLINGIEYIHKKGVCHRDLKPENLLLTNDKILKIIDFGLSHEYDGNILLKTKCGSPSYAAPELIKGKHYDGFQIDVWCCGIVLYAMVCGYLPFEGETNKELFKNILECNPEIPDNLSKSCKKLLKSILVVDPNKSITVEGIMQSDFYLKGKELCKKHYDFNLEELDRKSYMKKTDEKYNDNNNNKETDNHNKECNTNAKESNDNNNKEINSNEKKINIFTKIDFINDKSNKKNDNNIKNKENRNINININIEDNNSIGSDKKKNNCKMIKEKEKKK